MKKVNTAKRHQNKDWVEVSQADPDRIQFAEARAQVEGHKADGIREFLVTPGNLPSDEDLLVKLAEARQARETIAQYVDPYAGNLAFRGQVFRELLRKAELDGPVAPPKHARFAVFLLPRAYQQIIFGDLEEQYPVWVTECGQRKATFLYWWQFLLSTAILAWPRMRRWRYLALGLLLLTPAATHFLPSGAAWTSLWTRLLQHLL
jgi:hypothetical protein